MEDPLDALFIFCYVTDSYSGDKEELLNESLAHTPKQFHMEILSVEEPTSKNEG